MEINIKSLSEFKAEPEKPKCIGCGMSPKFQYVYQGNTYYLCENAVKVALEEYINDRENLEN